MNRKDVDLAALVQKKAQMVVSPGTRVYLYGSRARGDAHKGSDWDILILLDKPRVEMADYDTVAFPLTELGWKYGEAVIPVLYGIDEWNDSANLLFRKNVEEDAIPLV